MTAGREPVRNRRLLIITDAWEPQTNGVVTTLKSVIATLPELGWQAEVIHPGSFRTWPLPSYPEIRFARNPWKLKRLIAELRPDAIHIATEGPLGMTARSLLCRWLVPFTTSLHTKFPEYVQERIGLPLSLGYRLIRWFHRPARSTLVTTPSHRDELLAWGLDDLLVWGRGVDTELFRPAPHGPRSRPQLLYVGRIAVEKNVAAFLELDMDADKVVVGDGPARAELKARFPDARWLGYRRGAALAACYADADVFVFPSKTDTFGLVMLEALACGTPVAAYPVTGPRDVIVNGETGWLDADLGTAVRRALSVDREGCRAFAEANSWRVIGGRLVDSLALIDWASCRRLPGTAPAGTMPVHEARTASGGA